jgi:biopolymer transport protein ExbB
LPDVFGAVRDFVQSGGDVVRLIALVTFVMWVLIFERLWYLRRVHPLELARVLQQWRARADRSSWYAKQVRRSLVSEVGLGLQRSLGAIKTLVAICPLLGLLGTVTGMIEVFEIMALTGSSNARAMASGVSKATIPTMAGMVAALSGLYLSIWLERTARNETARTADRLTEH